jgi:hypothetical protein
MACQRGCSTSTAICAAIRSQQAWQTAGNCARQVKCGSHFSVELVKIKGVGAKGLSANSSDYIFGRTLGMPFARINLEEVSDEGKSPLIIQVLLDSNKMPVPLYPYAGWRGRPCATEWCWPLVFKPDGTVVYSGDGSDLRGEREGEMNIYEQSIEVGVRYTMKHFDGSDPSHFIVRDINVMKE